MKEYQHIYLNVSDWMDGSGPMSDIVLSSRIRLARNIAGFLFFSHAGEAQQAEVLDFVRGQVMQTELKDDLWYIGMADTAPLERRILSERHLISQRLADTQGAGGVVLSHDESLVMMVNEEDHIRIQVLASGLQLEEAYDNINRIDNLLEDKIDYAFSPKYGYLTACPTNVGTGMRVSVMLHLPALKMIGQIEKVFQAARDMHLAVRGLYGEGTEPVGDFYQLSNQTTLGKTESQIIEQLITQAVEPIVEYERRAREKLLKDRLTVLDDKLYRALGTLASARLISSEEAAYMLSLVRLGVHLGRLKDISIETVNELFLLSQPGHLQNVYKKKLGADERDIVRAEFIRERIS